ncbi:MAG: hypothetical protein HOI66_03780 [Verrucomicrobia bacterium]|jgi:hypothetical protein|nr:hypothetical protein [Verrucomicrobiota bacterium]
MKHTKLMGLRSLFAFVAAIGFAGISNVSGATSGNLVLDGEVDLILSIAVTPEPGASSMSPSTLVSSLAIANVYEICNDADGYTVSVSSSNGVGDAANSGVLTGATAAEDLSYSLTYGGTSVGFVNGSAQVTDSSSKTPDFGELKSIDIAFDGTSSNLAADSYSDTLTFTIAAK